MSEPKVKYLYRISPPLAVKVCHVVADSLDQAWEFFRKTWLSEDQNIKVLEGRLPLWRKYRLSEPVSISVFREDEDSEETSHTWEVERLKPIFVAEE